MFNSFINNLRYLGKNIDILINTFLREINSIFDIIEKESNYFIEKKFCKINILLKVANLEFNSEQKEKWKNLCDEYKETREKIVNTKDLIFNLSSIILDNNDDNNDDNKGIVDYKYNKNKDLKNKMNNNNIKIVN